VTSNPILGVNKRPADAIMWQEFEALCSRLRVSQSRAGTDAVRDWIKAHRDDPTPPLLVKPNPRAIKTDPFKGQPSR
jgi:hypothetical protein